MRAAPWQESADIWAEETFGATQTGDKRCTRRLIDVASRMASAPSGRVTRLFTHSADRLGAYRLLERPRLTTETLQDAVGHASMRRGVDEPFLFVPVDQTSLSLSDPSKVRELGPVTSSPSKSRGLEVMNALVLRPTGDVVGLADQEYWRREEGPLPAAPSRPFSERESRYWLDVMKTCQRRRNDVDGTRLWFLNDRGGDIGESIAVLSGSPDWFTVRMRKTRSVWDAGESYTEGVWHGHRQQALELLRKQPVLGMLTAVVPGESNQPPRQALMETRAARVRLQVKHPERKKKVWVTLSVVWIREVTPGHVPNRLEWVLWTNYAVRTFEDAQLVSRGYTFRWRVEEFHRCWKTIVQVEQNQLQRQETITKFATIGAAVAARIERLKRVARATPELAATAEFSRTEIDAIILLREPKGYRSGDTPTVQQCVEWTAELGGYTGQTNSRHPPGSETISRGLLKVAVAAEVLQRVTKI